MFETELPNKCLFLIKGNQTRKGGRKITQKTNVTFHSPVLLFGLHNDEVPLVVNFFVQEIIIFLEKENKMRTLSPMTSAMRSG